MKDDSQAPRVGAPVEAPPGHGPDLRLLFGRWTRLEPLDPVKHGHELYASFADSDPNGAVWTYLAYGPWSDFGTFSAWLITRAALRDPWFYAFIRRDTGLAAGMGSFMRHDGANGAIEIGHIWMAPGLQRTREATDVIFLMMRHAFDDLGVRRLEWKCDALNAPSRRAAERFGFSFEGVFRQHMIVKGRNRDTAWYALMDHEWPKARAGFQAWLADTNFDAKGRQKQPLRAR